jgi:hydrogenase expression/formation protein HypE
MSDRLKVHRPFVGGEIRDERVVAGHGSGGRKMHRLVREVFLKHFGNPELDQLGDAAVFGQRGSRLAMSTDSYVVRPLFFPGGDIGKLAVCGTVNDLAVAGARPERLSAGFILREGLELAVLDRICASMARTARAAGVRIVTGDTKVLERGTDEGIYINTTGVGSVKPGTKLGPSCIRPGDALVVTGPLGRHEAAIALARGGFGFRGRVLSDCAPLDRACAAALKAGGVRMMRDPTRGGLATTLNEIADQSRLGFVLDEALVPVTGPVRAIAALLGFDPLYMANEGTALVVTDARRAGRVVAALRRAGAARGARVIGTVVKEPAGVWLKTGLGSLRRLIMLEGEQLPRIC